MKATACTVALLFSVVLSGCRTMPVEPPAWVVAGQYRSDGDALLANRNLKDACLAYENAWSRAKSHDLMPMMALCYSRTGRLLEAQALYRKYLRDGVTAGARIKRQLKTLDRRIPTLALQFEQGSMLPENTVVKLDGREATQGTHEVNPGEHIAVVEVPGREPLKKWVTVGEVEHLTVWLHVPTVPRQAQAAETVHVPRKAVAPPPLDPSKSVTQRHPLLPTSTWIAIGVGAVTVLGLGTALVVREATRPTEQAPVPPVKQGGGTVVLSF